jgi:von Willebrand factor type A domain/Aerotolerance regulator N-terminal
MYFLNLSFLQFVAVFGSISAISVALYLLDRSRRNIVVSTLRFWAAAEQPAVAARRRRIQQPWSLLLQLVSMALLVLAIAQLRLGAPAASGRDHVIVLDTSSWMAARSGNRTLMDLARDRAKQYLRALPARDRVMLVRADGLTTPATAFEPDRRKVENAINASQPGSTALNLDQALAFARHVQGQDGRRVGEIAFIGPGRTASRDAANAPAPPRNLRVIAVPDNVENVGLRRVGMRRAGGDSDTWEIYVSVRNYGTRPHSIALALDFGPPGTAGKVAAGSQSLTLSPGAEQESTFEYKTAAAGILGVTLTPHDSFPADDRAELELPAQPSLAVIVYSNEPDLLKPALGATGRVSAIYRKPEEYRPDDRGLVILDRFVPSQRPNSDSIWIDPPSLGSPVPVRSRVEQVQFSRWNAGHPAAGGLHTRDFKLDHASVFETGADDGRVGEVEAGPVIVTRAGTPKIAVLGFHPALSEMRYELATPLLFANLLHWMSPEIFRRSEVSGSSVGAIKVVMDKPIAAPDVKVTGEDGSALPFTLRDRTINFFSGAPGGVKVVAGDREYLYSLTLPELWDTKWTPPADVHSGIPRFTQILDSSRDLWPLLAVAGGLGLLAEWLMYGRFRRSFLRRRTVSIRSALPADAVEARR